MKIVAKFSHKNSHKIRFKELEKFSANFLVEQFSLDVFRKKFSKYNLNSRRRGVLKDIYDPSFFRCFLIQCYIIYICKRVIKCMIFLITFISMVLLFSRVMISSTFLLQ